MPAPPISLIDKRNERHDMNELGTHAILPTHAKDVKLLLTEQPIIIIS